MNKYKNKKTLINGIEFASKKEGNRYLELQLLERAGSIKELELQKRFEIQPAFTLNNKKIRPIYYIADFFYYDKEKQRYIVEDVKGFRVKEYRIKKKIFEYKYGIEIEEI